MAKDTRAQDRIRELETEVNQTKGDIGDIRGAVNQTQSDIHDLKDTMTRMETIIAELSSKFLHSATNNQTDGNGNSSNNSGGRSRPQFGVFNSNQNTNYTFPTKFSRIEFPRFDGSDYKGWVFRCKQFFDIDSTPADQRIKLTSLHLEGRALQWHQNFMRRKRTGDVSWGEYLQCLATRFGDILKVDPMSELKNLRQEGSVAEYEEKFEEIMVEIDLAEELAISMFLGGLQDEIQAPVRMFKPTTLVSAMYLARLQEASVQAIRGQTQAYTRGINSITTNPPVNVTTRNQYTSFPKTQYSYSAQKTTFPTMNSTKTQPNFEKPIKQLTKKEMDEKRKKGLCYWCSEKYTHDHQCKNSQLFMIVAQEELNDTEEDRRMGELEVGSDFSSEQETMATLNAVMGEAHYSTMKVSGFVKKQPVILLLDTGSTHNFVDMALAKRLKLKVEFTKEMKVSVANGEAMKVSTKCSQLEWSMQGEKFTDDFYVMALGGYDLILGVQWLSTLGKIAWDLQQQVMGFTLHGKQYEILGDNMKNVRIAEAAIQENQLTHSQAFLLQMHIQQEEQDSKLQLEKPIITETQEEELQHILKEFSDVFQEPKGLPPQRSFDHAIHLKEPHPVSLRPYKYGPLQKNAIEELVQEMLKQGVIRASNSSFASPVVLVKKKDGSWRFCVDYRRLNDQTIKSKFPIPVIEELLDELYGSAFFSKLDLRAGYHQIRMQPSDIHKTAFRTHDGLYEFVVMPFGLTNAPATFQGLMNAVFRPFLRKYILVFFDDILVYSKSWQEHMSHLKNTLQTLRDHTLFAKKSKCMFGATQIDYLGHIISKDGVATDPKKTEAMLSWPTPTTIKSLRGFLGLTGYYRRFVQHFGVISRPLTVLL